MILTKKHFPALLTILPSLGVSARFSVGGGVGKGSVL